MWFDSHCHLHLCEDGPGIVVRRAGDAGVTGLLTVGIDIDSSRTALELAGGDGVVAACGVHPNDCGGFGDDDLAALEGMVARGAAAVGESGLDFYRDRVDRNVQRRVFDAHIELAKRHGKPLVVHTRDSMDAALDQLEATGPPGAVVFHCWSGSPHQLRRALDLGAYVSFAGNVSFRSAQDLREAAALVPEDRLLIETDSPFLTPEPYRGRPNEPARVAQVGEAVAACRDIPGAEVAEITARNARSLFGV